LLAGIVEPAEQRRFLALVERLPDLGADDLSSLNLKADPTRLAGLGCDRRGIF
jgi:hypothetical protein